MASGTGDGRARGFGQGPCNAVQGMGTEIPSGSPKMVIHSSTRIRPAFVVCAALSAALLLIPRAASSAGQGGGHGGGGGGSHAGGGGSHGGGGGDGVWPVRGQPSEGLCQFGEV